MLKEIFGQPADGADKKTYESENDRLIDEEIEHLQALMDRASTTVKMALKNEFLTEDDAEKLYSFLEKIAGEINETAEADEDAGKMLARLNELGDMLMLPGDIKRENIKESLEGMEKLEREKLAEPVQTEDSRRHKGEITGNFYLSRKRNPKRQNRKNDAEARTDS